MRKQEQAPEASEAVQTLPITVNLGHGVDFDSQAAFSEHMEDAPGALESMQTAYLEQHVPNWGLDTKADPFGKEGPIEVILASGDKMTGKGYLSLGAFLPGGVVVHRYAQDSNELDSYIESEFIPYGQFQSIKHVSNQRKAQDEARKTTSNVQ